MRSWRSSGAMMQKKRNHKTCLIVNSPRRYHGSWLNQRNNYDQHTVKHALDWCKYSQEGQTKHHETTKRRQLSLCLATSYRNLVNITRSTALLLVFLSTIVAIATHLLLEHEVSYATARYSGEYKFLRSPHLCSTCSRSIFVLSTISRFACELDDSPGLTAIAGLLGVDPYVWLVPVTTFGVEIADIWVWLLSTDIAFDAVRECSDVVFFGGAFRRSLSEMKFIWRDYGGNEAVLWNYFENLKQIVVKYLLVTLVIKMKSNQLILMG